MDNPAVSGRNGAAEVAEETFEALLERLHDIVTQLESGDLTLDDTLARFQEGSALAERCLQMIEAAELKVHELSTDTSSPFNLG